jgi:hypothetical protein
MLFEPGIAHGQVAIWLLSSTVVFLIAAAFLGWVLQFLWSLLRMMCQHTIEG